MTIWPLPAKVTDEPKPSPGDGLALGITRHLPVRVLKRNTRPGLLASAGAPKTISSPAAAIEKPNWSPARGAAAVAFCESTAPATAAAASKFWTGVPLASKR